MKKISILGTVLLIASSFAGSGEYRVVKDDNLWNISGDYLGDPYQWQRLWNANTHIQNPDLIYPGDSIVIPGKTMESTVESNGDAFEIEEKVAVTFNDKVAGLRKNDEKSDTVVEESVSQRTPLEQYFDRRKNLYSRSRRRSAPYLITTSENLVPGIGRIDDDSHQVYGLNTMVTIVMDEGQTVSMGDRYDLCVSAKTLNHNDSKAAVIRPLGSGVVTTVMGDSARMRIVEAWDVIKDGARIQPVRSFETLENPTIERNVTPVEVSMLTRIDQFDAIKPNEVMLLNGGKDKGVQVGDLFEGFETTKKGTEQEPSIRGIIITVDENSCAFVTQEVYRYVGTDTFTMTRYGRLKFE